LRVETAAGHGAGKPISKLIAENADRLAFIEAALGVPSTRGAVPGHDPRQPHREHIRSGSPFEAQVGFSRAVRVGDRVLVAGTAPIWPDGSCLPGPADQARRCFEIIVAALAKAGAGPADVVRTRIYLTSADDAGEVGSVHAEYFGAARPVATMVVVAALLDPRWRVEVEAEAILS
jgi:enamine deaminase RidA (YjgF/YER057c/UK114 family)